MDAQSEGGLPDFSDSVMSQIVPGFVIGALSVFSIFEPLTRQSLQTAIVQG